MFLNFIFNIHKQKIILKNISKHNKKLRQTPSYFVYNQT
jgi:hypothetical protein